MENDLGVVKKPSHFASVTPDRDARIRRARGLTDAVARLQAKMAESGTCEIPLDPGVTAQGLVYDRLGVTRNEVGTAMLPDNREGLEQRADAPRGALKPVPCPVAPVLTSV